MITGKKEFLILKRFGFIGKMHQSQKGCIGNKKNNGAFQNRSIISCASIQIGEGYIGRTLKCTQLFPKPTNKFSRQKKSLYSVKQGF